MSITCNICSRVIQPSQALTIPCGHVFDTNCITQRLQQHNDCPICKKPCSLSDVRTIHFKQTDTDDNVASLQNKLNQVTLELAEARKEIAYKLPNINLLNEQIAYLKKINQLQENEISALREQAGKDVKVNVGDTGKTSQVNTSEQAAIIQKQDRMIKALKESIAQHDVVCKEVNYEEKYERAIRKCEKYKREVKDCERSMREMNENFYDREDSMDRDREDTLQELREQVEECEENHGDISRVISERDAAIRKYENLLRETEAKEKLRQAKAQEKARTNQAKAQQQTKISQATAQQTKTNQPKSQQTRTNQPVLQLPKSRGQAIAKTANNKQANTNQASSSRPVHTQPQQHPPVAYSSQKPQQVSQPYAQQYAPQQQPLLPQQQLHTQQPLYTQQPLNTQLQGSKSQLRQLQPAPPHPPLQWQVYVLPDPKSKKRKISEGGTKSSPLSQQQAIPNQKNMNPLPFPQQQMNTHPPQQQMNTHPPQQQMNPYPPQQQMNTHPPQQQMNPYTPQQQTNPYPPQQQTNPYPPQQQTNPYPPYPPQMNVPPPPQQINPHPPQQPQLAPFQHQQQHMGPYPHSNMNPNVQQPQWVSTLPPSSHTTNGSKQPLTRADGTKPDEEDIIDLTQ